MNYARIYSEFIADRLTKQPVKPTYFERHHILPRCLGGGNEKSNIIRLMPEDHLFAHILLARIHGGSLWHAVAAMTMQSHRRSHSDGYVWRSRKIYAKARIEAAAAHSAIMKGRFTGADHPMWGIPCSELSKQKTRERFAAGFSPMGTPEARKKVSDALKGRVFTAAHCLKISTSKMGVKDSDETRKRKSDGHKGLIKSDKTRAKLSASLTGRKLSATHVEKMRVLNTGKSLSDETRQKISDNWKENGHPKGMLGKVHAEATKKRMTDVNGAKREYSRVMGCSPKRVTIAMINAAGISIGAAVINRQAEWQQNKNCQLVLFGI